MISTDIARYYPVTRTAHLERLSQMARGEFLYSATRLDWDKNLAQATPNVVNVTFGGVLRRVWRQGYRILEVPEPLAISLLPRLVALALLVQIRNWTRGGCGTKFVFYAIENFDQIEKIRSKVPLPAGLVRAAINAGLRIVFLQTSRAAFGAEGALETYQAQLGSSAWSKITQRTDVRLFPALAPATAETFDKNPDQVCFLGSFEHRKGVLELLSAWPLVSARCPAATLTILGHGELVDVVRAFVRRTERATLIENPSRVEIRRILGESHSLVLLSQRTPRWREQIGLPILEALSAGCEIVTSTETGIADWLKENGHHTLDPKCSSVTLANAIVETLQNSRTADEVKASLPDVDGRLEADSWMFEEHSPQCDCRNSQ